MTFNVPELRERKRTLEREILTLISTFEQQTDASVEQIYLTKLIREREDGTRQKFVGFADVKIEL
jgi:hypothetical protein